MTSPCSVVPDLPTQLLSKITTSTTTQQLRSLLGGHDKSTINAVLHSLKASGKLTYEQNGSKPVWSLLPPPQPASKKRKACDVLTAPAAKVTRVDPVAAPIQEHPAVIAQKAALARLTTVMEEHGLIALGWQAGFDNAKSSCGKCSYKRKWIQISRYYASSCTPQELEETIKHEVAHSIVGPGHGHDAVWKAKALEIGSNGKRCAEKRFLVAKWAMICECGKSVFPRHKINRNQWKRKVCVYCRSAFHKKKNPEKKVVVP